MVSFTNQNIKAQPGQLFQDLGRDLTIQVREAQWRIQGQGCTTQRIISTQKDNTHTINSRIVVHPYFQKQEDMLIWIILLPVNVSGKLQISIIQ